MHRNEHITDNSGYDYYEPPTGVIASANRCRLVLGYRDGYRCFTQKLSLAIFLAALFPML